MAMTTAEAPIPAARRSGARLLPFNRRSAAAAMTSARAMFVFIVMMRPAADHAGAAPVNHAARYKPPTSIDIVPPTAITRVTATGGV
jgi:hypothetical protein